jgi:hypothetical protein
MKSQNLFIYIGLVGILILGIFIYSCSKESPNLGENNQIPDEVINEICPNCESYAFWLPENTTIEEIEGENGVEIIMTAPEGYLYYGFSSDSSLISYEDKAPPFGSSVTVTCDCTNGSDDNCNPVGNNGIINCVISPGCTTCERKEKVKDPVTKENEIEILTGGFINPDLGITFAQIEDDLPYAFEAMFYYPELKVQFDSFILNFYENFNEQPEPIGNGEQVTAPPGYRFHVLNAFGRAIVTLLPENKEAGAGGVTYSCDCLGTGVCDVKKVWNPFGGNYYFCEKNESNPCTKACNTMTVTDDTKNEVYTYTYYFF